MKGDWTRSVPVWVSRKTASGMVSAFSLPMWFLMAIGMVASLNAIAWGVIGLIEVVQYADG